VRTRLFVHGFIKTLGERCAFEADLNVLASDTRYAMYLPHLFVPPGGCRHIVIQGDAGTAHHLSWLEVCAGLLVVGPLSHYDDNHPYVVRARELNLPIYKGLGALRA
jgi:hypothetical protein